MNNKKPYQIDKNTYNEIQKLKEFVELVAELAYFEKTKNYAEEIISLIDTIDQYETHKQWAVELSIEDYQYGDQYTDDRVVYQAWNAIFENGSLSIEAKTDYSSMRFDDTRNERFDLGVYFWADIYFFIVGNS